MSEGTRIALGQAQYLAGEVLALLRPLCERLEIAGSVRRQKRDVGDIELVGIPRASLNLLGEVYRSGNGIESALQAAGYKFTRFNGEHFKQFDLGPCHCDLFLTTPECWGVIYTIRTGSADFSHKLVTPRNQGGLMPSYMQCKDGRLVVRSSGDKLNTPEEIDVFRAMNLAWVEPEAR